MSSAPFLIARFHEVALKGKNRPFFIRALAQNLERATAGAGVKWVRPGHMMVLAGLEDDVDWQQLKDRLATVFGANKYYPAYRLSPLLDEVKAFLAKALPDRRFSSFRITARREDKSFPSTSQDIMRDLGAYVQGLTGARVDLTHAELDIRVEVMPRGIYVYFEEWPGPGGLPVGVSGRVVGLLSGGIDSPVAAWYMMKRGCQVALVHFHSFPLVDRSSIEKVVELTEMLTRYQYSSQLHLVPFAAVQKHILVSVPVAFRVILYRRFMLRIAEALAHREGAKALVTGDSLGQVSSQTLDNMATIQAAVTIPVLRPLIGMDKQEIMTQAQRLGTYPISILPDQDCCSLFVPRHPALHATAEEVARLEEQLDVPGLVAEALSSAELREFEFPRASKAEKT